MLERSPTRSAYRVATLPYRHYAVGFFSGGTQLEYRIPRPKVVFGFPCFGQIPRWCPKWPRVLPRNSSPVHHPSCRAVQCRGYCNTKHRRHSGQREDILNKCENEQTERNIEVKQEKGQPAVRCLSSKVTVIVSTVLKPSGSLTKRQ